MTGPGASQPVVVLWAEQDVILHDQFRDGHVPAGCGNLRVLEQAVANLPQGLTQIAVRGDRALYETEVLRWCEAEDRRIAYAISADTSEHLKAEIVQRPGVRPHRPPRRCAAARRSRYRPVIGPAA